MTPTPLPQEDKAAEPSVERVADLMILLDEYRNETACVTYNGWSKRRPPEDVRKDIDAAIRALAAEREGDAMDAAPVAWVRPSAIGGNHGRGESLVTAYADVAEGWRKDGYRVTPCYPPGAQTSVLLLCQRLFKEALPRFNWGASALDANAIKLLNEVPAAVDAALAKEHSK